VKVLVVEDEPGVRTSLVELVEELGYEASAVGSVSDARDAFARRAPDVCITDLGLPDGSGLDVVRAAKAARPDCDVLVLTGKGSILAAVEAMRTGAHDFLLKPLKPAFLASTLARLSEHRSPHPVADSVPSVTGQIGEMVGGSSAMREIFRLIARVASSEAPVMITGESGSGKEVAARTVHALSRRVRGPFVAVNCGAISPNIVESELFGHEKGSFTGAERRRAGTFEMAHGGTLFLDEVTEMPPDLQVKFLRVLDTRTFRRVGGNEELDVDVRLVASSNRDLAEAVKSGRFRSDLFYRLNVFPLSMPPLRARKEDLPALASHFLAQVEERERRGFASFEARALDALGRYDWPGNVRELRNAVHRAYVLSDPPVVRAEAVEAVLDPSGAAARPPAGPEDQPAGPSVPVHVGERLDAVERKLLLATLQAVNGDRKAAARILGISLKTVYNRLKEYGLDHAPRSGGPARDS
jgi:two-component system, NtrC family, response regulator AtoC